MIKKITTLIITLSFLLPASVWAEDDSPSFLEILSPWESFKTYIGSDRNGIPQTYTTAYQSFLSWYSMFSPDYWSSAWTLKNGNKCEQLKITHLQNRTKYYLSALRDIQIGWIQGSLNEDRSTNIISFLETFLTKEFSRINRSDDTYSLLDKDISCDPSILYCTEADSKGEFCIQKPKLFELANDSLSHLQNLYCFQDTAGSTNITADNWTLYQGATIDYLKKVIDFYNKAQTLVSPIYTIDLNYDYNQRTGLEKTRASQASWENCVMNALGDSRGECGLEPTTAKSCLDSSEYPAYLNVNYQEQCGCPDLQVSWTDLGGIFEELLSSLKNLTQINKLMTEIHAMVTNAKDDSGKSWWEKFDDEIQQEAKSEFKAMFGYFPPDNTSPSSTKETTESYFQRLFNPLNRLKASLTLTNQVISPVPSLGLILSRLTSDGATAPITQITYIREQAQDRHTKEKELAAEAIP